MDSTFWGYSSGVQRENTNTAVADCSNTPQSGRVSVTVLRYYTSTNLSNNLPVPIATLL